MSETGPESPPSDEHLQRDILDSTKRLLASVKKSEDARIAAMPLKETADFDEPEAVGAQLTDAQAAYEAAWEKEAAKSTPQTDAQIREKLAKKGLFPNPPTEAEIKAAEEKTNAELRDEAAAKKAQDPIADSKPRNTASRSKPNYTTGVKGQIADSDRRVKDQRNLI